MRTILITLLLLAAPLTVHAGTWTARSSGVTTTLNAVRFANARVGYACGAGGTVLRTFDGGATWTKLTTGSTAELRDVVLSDSARVWVCGTGGTMLRTRDAGATWTALAPGTSGNLNAMALYIPGIAGDTIIEVGGDAGVSVFTIDAGAHWYANVTGSSADFHGVLDDYFGATVLAGTHGTLLYGTGQYLYPWPYPDTDDLVAMKGRIAGGPTTLYLLGSGGVVTKGVASWTWTTSSSGVSGARGLEVIGRHRWVVGAAGVIRHSADDGATWGTQGPVISGSWNAIAMVDTATGCVVGDGGHIAVSHDAHTTAVESGAERPGVAGMVLAAPTPNPASGLARVTFALVRSQRASLRLYDVSGRLVRTLLDRECSAGPQSVAFDAGQLASGVYLVELRAGAERVTRRASVLH